MLNSRQRAQLRALANPLPCIFQIGKGGLNDNMLKQISIALENRELVKIHLLENSDCDLRETCQRVCEILHADPVQVIGSKFIIYRESKDNKTIELVK
ncbi:MAG: ribosome assembly RNA-binding protein YhbY [Ruminococcaceae bacterium]|nr:ribosome assembly RNA-binding protein YhbY [Oscillospiraceae bacterium]